MGLLAESGTNGDGSGSGETFLQQRSQNGPKAVFENNSTIFG
jgi:hypothetical protein